MARPSTAWNNGYEKHILGIPLRRYRIAYLYLLCGLNSREIAEELGLTINAVDSAIYKLRKS